MNRNIVLLIFFLICFINANSQSVQNSNLTTINVKAKYLKDDLDKHLAQRIRYPQDAIISNIQGDVILSCVIDKEGRLDKLTIINSPNNSLSTSSVVAINELGNEWSPAKFNNIPVDKTYLFIFRYRIYLNTQPVDYNRIANRLIKKQKFEKALKLYNQAIKDNKYSCEYFESRSKIKETLGDIEGAKKDKLTSLELNDQILSVINVNAVGFTRTVVKKVVTSNTVN